MYRYLVAEKYFEKIDVFEQRSSVGGIWNYSPSSDKTKRGLTSVPQLNPNEPPEEPIWHQQGKGQKNDEADFISPLYSRLETNIPKEIMQFSDRSFAYDTPLFPKHRMVKKYLEDYADDVRQLIHFETQVLDLKSNGHGTGSWGLTTRSLRSGIKKTDLYDAVVVASGHYAVPYIPDIAGIKTWNSAYPGVISHSKFYDSPEFFHDKKVVVVGNSASGVDIGAQISEFCRGKLLLSSKTLETIFSGTSDTDKIDCPEIVEFLSPSSHNRGIKFANGRVEEGIDAIVFSTGYFYSYPFLSSLNPPVVTNGERAMNVYEQLFYTYDPTIVFPVLPQRVIPFPLSENQAAVFARVWSDRLSLPSQAEMKSWEDAVVSKKGNGKPFHFLNFPQDADYLNFLYDWAAKAKKRPGLENSGNGKQGPRWGDKERWLRQRFPEIRKAYVGKGQQREKVKNTKELGFNYEEWELEQKRGASRL